MFSVDTAPCLAVSVDTAPWLGYACFCVNPYFCNGVSEGQPRSLSCGPEGFN